jgi:two-component system nitrate/nitrite sensor histidine kinase NarX
MSKKNSSVKNPVSTGNMWAEDSGFALSEKGESTVMFNILTHSVAQNGHVKSLLDELLGNLIECVNASCGIIRLVSPHGQSAQLISSDGCPAELLDAEKAEGTICDTCNNAFNIRGIYTANLRACKSPQDCHYAGYQFQSLISATIESHTAPKKYFGILTLFYNEAQEPFERTSKTVLAFSRLLGAIIEHNKSNRDAKRADLIAERQAIANEIHDSLAQSLVYTRMRTSLLLEAIRSRNEIAINKYAHDIDDALENSQKTVRELITDFRCSMDPSGLLHALQALTEQFCHRNRIELEYLNRVSNLDLPLEYEIQVYHIVREALANIATHSEANHARLIVEFSGNNYVFTIEDNGSGGCTFTPVEGHYGMVIMRERAQRIGGKIKLESSKGFGTRVQLIFPEPGSDWRAVNE